ncbi:insulinase family protein [Candidatus Dojkabacteria bacterium]|nr:insulinase family protein [Candidatus Dojkabacteria bacterium]
MKYSQKTLSNGLRTISIEDKDSLSVTALILVNTGSRFENETEAGIAHFVEHTIFKGTEKRPDIYQIGMEVESLGAKMNAFTSYDYTGYYIKCPKEKFEKAFEILSDMFLNSLFRDKDINKERGVILEELRMYEDQPMEKVYSVFSELLFGSHSLGRDIIGTKETIEGIRQSAFKKFVEKYYNAKNTVIAVAGGARAEDVNSQIEKHFSKFKTGKLNKVKEKFKIDKRAIKKSKNLRKPINQSHLILGGFAPGRAAKDKKYAIKVANAVLGRGFGSKLFQEIREKQGLAYYVYSDINRFAEIGDYKIAMGVENSKVQDAIDGVVKQIEDMKKGKFSEDELIRAKNYLIGGLSLDLESTNQLALWYGSQVLLETEMQDIDEVRGLIQTANRDRIVSVCKELFAKDNIFLASVTPHKKLQVDF